MNRVFQARGFFRVPDLTDVSPFLNATDVMQEDVPWDALGDMGIAAGRIGPGVHSVIHVHPVVTQVTYVTDGMLTVRMREAASQAPYDLSLSRGQAVVTRPGTLFQLRNDSDAPADVLYIVSPSYVFEKEGDDIRYDDAVLMTKSWDNPAITGFDVAAFRNLVDRTQTARADALRRLAARKGVTL